MFPQESNSIGNCPMMIREALGAKRILKRTRLFRRRGNSPHLRLNSSFSRKKPHPAFKASLPGRDGTRVSSGVGPTEERREQHANIGKRSGNPYPHFLPENRAFRRGTRSLFPECHTISRTKNRPIRAMKRFALEAPYWRKGKNEVAEAVGKLCPIREIHQAGKDCKAVLSKVIRSKEKTRART